MNKIEFMRLWDAYSNLLTPTQQEITNLYFNLDLTLSEIAEQKGISRQAVSDCLNGCKKQLEEYEEKLHMVRATTEYCLEVSFMMTKACKWADKFAKAHPEFAADMEELQQIIKKDYSEEVREELEKPETWELLNKDYSKEIEADLKNNKV